MSNDLAEDWNWKEIRGYKKLTTSEYSAIAQEKALWKTWKKYKNWIEIRNKETLCVPLPRSWVVLSF